MKCILKHIIIIIIIIIMIIIMIIIIIIIIIIILINNYSLFCLENASSVEEQYRPLEDFCQPVT